MKSSTHILFPQYARDYFFIKRIFNDPIQKIKTYFLLLSLII